VVLCENRDLKVVHSFGKREITNVGKAHIFYAENMKIRYSYFIK
jgi:hypothetical protein